MEQKSAQALIREAQLEEYRTLRQEILDYTKYQNELVTFAFSGSAAIFTLAVSEHKMSLLVAIYVLLVPLRCRHTFYQELIIKIAAYISTVVEPSVQGLGWEHITHHPEFENKMKNAFTPSRLVYFIFSLVAWIGVAFISSQIHTDTALSNLQKYLIIFVAIGSSIFISYLDWVMLKKADIVRKKYESIWKKKELI